MKGNNNNKDARPTVFLDTTVLMQYLCGGSPESRLLSDGMLKRFRFAVNPVVLSELMLGADIQKHPERFQRIQDSVNILPINDSELQRLLGKLQSLRNKVTHSNDFLIYSSAVDCDYLLTQDENFQNLANGKKPVTLTTEEFLHRVEHS